MIRALTTSGNGIDVVVGKAGAGKTLALDAARAAWQASGHTVIGCSLAARAAAQLEADAGIPAATISRLTIELSRRPLPERSVVIVDEAAMVGTRTLTQLAQLTERAGAKLVVVGDDRQLPAIDAGGGFRALTQTLTPLRLDINRRQHHEWERTALDQLASGRPEPALTAYEAHGRITTGPNAEKTRNRLVADWHAGQQRSEDGPMLALHRSDVDDLNHRARRQLKAAGQLAGDELELGGRSYAIGEQVIGRRNDYRTGILNGTRATITALHHQTGTVTVRTSGGEQLKLSRSYLAAGHLDYGYALTVHKAQGATWNTAYVLGDDRLYREAGYVALSRARHTTRLYTLNDNDHDEHHTLAHARPQDRLTNALTRSHAQESIRELTIGNR